MSILCTYKMKRKNNQLYKQLNNSRILLLIEYNSAFFFNIDIGIGFSKALNIRFENSDGLSNEEDM